MASSREIVGGLQVHPKFGGVLEVSGQKQSCLRRNSSLAAHQLIHPVQGDGERPRQLSLGQAQRFEKLLQQDLSGMSSDTMARQHGALLFTLLRVFINPWI
jgi:hypothetical protein